MTERRLFNDDDITDPLRTEADDDFIVQDGSYGDVAFPAMAVIGDGFLLDSGNAGVTFPYSGNGDGFLLDTGTAGVAFGFALAGTGTVEASEPLPELSGGGLPIRQRLVPTRTRAVAKKKPTVVVMGDGSVGFGFGVAGAGDINDDDLAFSLLLAA